MYENRRPRVGIMTGSFHTDYSRTVTDRLSRELLANGYEVTLFQGLDASRFLTVKGYVDEGFDEHYYTLYEYSRFMELDFLIVSFGTISAVPLPLDMERFLSCIARVPVILLETEYESEGVSYVTMDNYTGMRSCVEHLIADHGLREILYISGPKNVYDARVRLKAYEDAMASNGLAVPEGGIVYGNFTDRIDDLVEELLRRFPHPEAIVCANDDMAESVYRVLKARGLEPGRDVAVTGFDNNSFDNDMEPPLTSVTQDYDGVSACVLGMLDSLKEGKTPDSVRLPARLIKRGSCRCGSDTKTAVVGRAVRDRGRIKLLTDQNILISLMLRNILTENITVHGFFERLGGLLNSLGTGHSRIALLREPLRVEPGARLFVPEKLRLHMEQDGDAIQSWTRFSAPVVSEEHGCGLTVPTRDGLVSAVFPLFYGDTHYGVLAVTLNNSQMAFYYALSLEIGTGLKYLYMALSEQDTRRALEEKNQILDYSATHDGLTGLLNRVGLMNEIYDTLKSCSGDTRLFAVMADLDHLKQINDTFGHAYGDIAIRAAADVLQEAFPASAPLGRTGGDEFASVFRAPEGMEPDELVNRIRAACEEFDTSHEYPFYFSISIGCVELPRGDFLNVPALLQEADVLLYEAKKLRRQSVIK